MVPKCIVVERGIFDLKDTIHVREQVDVKRPKELVQNLLPKVESIASVDLDVTTGFSAWKCLICTFWRRSYRTPSLETKAQRNG